MNDKILRSAQDDKENREIFRVCAECEGMLRDAGYALERVGRREFGGCDCCERKDIVQEVRYTNPKRRRSNWKY